MATQLSISDNKPWIASFFTIWGGQALSILGSQLVQFALIWYMTVQTGSAIVLATATLVGTLPNIALGPFVGTLVDRWNRRRVMLTADSLIALTTVALAVLFMLSRVQIWHIYLVMFVRALANAFHSNAMSASTSLMVPVEHLTRIQGLNQMLDGGLNIATAPLGALLLGVLPMQGVLMIDVITALIAILPLLLIQVPQPERAHASGVAQATVWQDLRAGLRYIWKWPGLLLGVAMTIGINFTIIPAFSLLPLLVRNYFGGNAIQLGRMQAAMGIGMFVGGALLGVWGGFKRRILTTLLGLLGMGIGALLIALTPVASFALAIGGVLLVGMMTPVMMGPFFAIIQSQVEPDMQGRVLSLLQSVGAGAVPLGLLVAGLTADYLSIQFWFLLSGSLCILIALSGPFVPAVMNIEAPCSGASIATPG
ncbi:MAG: MFS transporter [Anaerolineae bacterium]|nr:MFS transporter [Anaerolineae bacterium]